MKRQLISVAVLAVVMSQIAVAQQVMTLRECIDYAAAHSTTIRQKQISVEKSENELSTQKGDYLPSVNGYVGQNFDFGRGLTVDNTYTNRNTRSTSLGIQANMTLFNGLQNVNGVKVARLNLAAATDDLQAAKEDLGINVAQAYLTVLCDKEIAAAAHEQAELSKAQLERKEALLKNGKTSESDVYEARSLVAQDEVTAIKADNDYKLALLTLSQLLELPSPEGFDVAMPDTTVSINDFTTPDAIYQEALAGKASVRAAQTRTEVAEKQISVAKGAYAPTLSLSAGISSGYYGIAGEDNESFGNQLDQNLDKSIQLSLSIPIFNRFSTRNSVRSAKMDYTSSVVELEETRKTLYKEIQQAYYNAVAAKATYEGSTAAAESAEAAFRLADGKYAAGLSTSTEYAEARTNRLTALANKIQYKYEMMFRAKILDFYRGVAIE